MEPDAGPLAAAALPPRAARGALAAAPGAVPCHRGPGSGGSPCELAALPLPLPSARAQTRAEDPRGAADPEVLAEEGLTLASCRSRRPRAVLLRGERAALCLPAGVDARARATTSCTPGGGKWAAGVRPAARLLRDAGGQGR